MRDAPTSHTVDLSYIIMCGFVQSTLLNNTVSATDNTLRRITLEDVSSKKLKECRRGLFNTQCKDSPQDITRPEINLVRMTMFSCDTL